MLQIRTAYKRKAFPWIGQLERGICSLAYLKYDNLLMSPVPMKNMIYWGLAPFYKDGSDVSFAMFL